ncbi:MAG TPA: bifunctional [glutamate--ammonia ligase]-adenylyl-L-tyrosine phosphorylase/[glutamate--ammonia-ligase] adenylyltransferase [Methylophilus sp.]|nr:bifunctional [glutamate--ammonia ligase]-adenylyl-L-tyrosine phosphorylase/[glutamate--ammonia-ligase] adenylyltransferase [Methylophilus sp.]HQQ34079.1 bifunctional [glutamate--ammonia ligase]-adenylyl-L-tyrosine phosphorylase/[glutamate--ammonia-ligase] adenylyltransferase [Methylophilus sp.]
MESLDNLLLELGATPQQVALFSHAVACSPFLGRLLTKDKVLLKDLLENHAISYDVARMQQFLGTQIITDEICLKKILRQLRQRVMASTILRDLSGLADLQEVMQTTSALAECAVKTAIDYLDTWQVEIYGQPVDTNGYPQELIVVGMGKLGGGELNVSSDIDLIFAYESAGQTDGEQSISNQEFFTKLGKKLISALDDVTEDGFVFRVDMRLRPYGSEGALVSDLDALESYYQISGREWERYAWIKGRAVAGPEANIHALLRPFVFRKYLDYNAFASMRDLKSQIQRDVLQKGMQDNIKLGRGGIREIEFVAQVFQLIRGGREPELQIRPTLQVLKILKNKKLLDESTVDSLIEAYTFLRNLEHRLMYVEDQQTQELPKHEEARARIANSMGFPDWQTFLQVLNRHRNLVQQHFDATFSEDAHAELPAETAIWRGVISTEAAQKHLAACGFQDVAHVWQLLQSMRNSQRYQQLPEQSRQRLDKLMPMVLSQSAKTVMPDTSLLRTMNLLEHICRRASYLALLAEYPHSLELLVKLCAASPWLAQYLSAHPILLDELLDTRTLYAAPDFSVIKQSLLAQMQALAGDTEAQMDAMRHFKNSYLMRFAAQDINNELQLETLSDYLSALADVILQVSLDTIWQTLKFKHRETPQFAVIGYGKLGGKELGYTSDLDIIFLYDDNHPEAGDIYARFAQRINSWFNSMTNAGQLYETDLQLRPDGNSGLLVSSVDAFREYQANKAWTWEYQALTRARFVAGESRIGTAFETIRRDVMMQLRETDKLKQDVLDMREKMREANKAKPGMFDVKHSPGGIIDVEFIVQYLLLNYSNKYQQLTDNIGNIALLKMLATLKIIEAESANAVADAYRQYRRIIHQAKLQSQDAKIPVEEVAALQQAVLKLWQQVF